MSEENKDVNLEGGDDGSKNPPEGDPSAPPKSNEPENVPYHRFKEVNAKVRDLEQQLKSLNNKPSTPGAEDKEAQAKSYLKGLLRETLEEQKKLEVETKQKEQDAFNNEVDKTLELNADVKRADFLKFIKEKSDSYGITSVAGAMKLYRDFNNLSKESLEKAKKDLSAKPRLPNNEGGGSGGGKNSYGSSLQEIASNSIKEFGLK